MSRGPARKPIEQELREGKPGNRHVPEPLKFTLGEPIKPPDLPAAASELWDAIVPALTGVGVAQMPDTPALVALCVQWARAEEARELIDREGVVAIGSTGQMTTHPALKVERNAHLVFLKFAQEFGLTPAARARIVAALGGRGEHLEAELEDFIDAEPELVEHGE